MERWNDIELVYFKYSIIFTAGKNRGEVYEVDTCLYC